MKKLKYKDRLIEYDIIKSNIKNVYIQVKDEKVIVKAPNKLKEEQIKKIVETKKEWIYKKLVENEKRKKENRQVVKLLGKEYKLLIKFEDNQSAKMYIENDKLIIEIPKKQIDKTEQIKEELIDSMYKKVAEKEVDMAMQIITRIVGIAPKKYKIKKLKSAWGTCTSNQNITINSSLMQYDRKVIQYVVLHEVCHLKYMNHSREFWKMVEKYMKDYKEVKKILKR